VVRSEAVRALATAALANAFQLDLKTVRRLLRDADAGIRTLAAAAVLDLVAP
jgi:hypothetical protein